MMFRRSAIISLGINILLSLVCFVKGGRFQIGGYILLGLAAGIPFANYRAIARAVENNSQMADSKTVDFSPSGLVATGPNWRNEMPWTRFKGFSEDGTYFYLHLSENGMASIVPKSAFTAEQAQTFRDYAKAQIT
jgi:YcxB-like protein